MTLSKFLKNPFKDNDIKLLPAPKCEHVWNLFSKTYASPRTPENIDLPDNMLERLLFGVTTYVWECMSCGEIRTQESLGSDENHLYEILDKVKKYGMQYIEVDDSKFAIALVPKDDIVHVK